MFCKALNILKEATEFSSLPYIIFCVLYYPSSATPILDLRGLTMYDLIDTQTIIWRVMKSQTILKMLKRHFATCKPNPVFGIQPSNFQALNGQGNHYSNDFNTRFE